MNRILAHRKARLVRELGEIEGTTLSDKLRKFPRALGLLEASILLDSNTDALRKQIKRGKFRAVKIWGRYKCDPCYLAGLLDSALVTAPSHLHRLGLFVTR